MKKTLIASLAVLASAAVLATFALGGAGKFGDVRANADTTGYSITFDKDSTVEAVGDNYAIYTTTAAGNKVGVVGFDSGDARFTFNGVSFMELWLRDSDEDNDGDYDVLAEVGAYDFDHITGFAISFSGGSMEFVGGLDDDEVWIDPVESEKEYDDLSFTPDDLAGFMTNGEGVVVTVSSLTIWYSC